MQTLWGLISADVHRRNGWRSAFLQMATRMGNTRLFYFFIFIETPYMKFVLQSSDAPENCGFTRWVDPAPIDSVQEFIDYLQIKILIWNARWTITKKWARVTKTMKMMIPAMLPVHMMNHALFLTATALVTRRRALHKVICLLRLHGVEPLHKITKRRRRLCPTKVRIITQC